MASRYEVVPMLWDTDRLAEVEAAFANHGKSDTAQGMRSATEGIEAGVFVRLLVDGAPVGFYVLTPIQHANATEAEISLAYGFAETDLVDVFLPFIELQCAAFDAIKFQTCRPGLIKKMKAHGYRMDSVTMRKRK